MQQPDHLSVSNEVHIRSTVGPTRPAPGPAVDLHIDGGTFTAYLGEPLVDAINRARIELAQVCYHPQLGPIQTCDTCSVEIDGQIGRACGTPVAAGMVVRTQTVAARAAQRDAYDRIVSNHDLYCTVCDNNNGNCTVHNTLGVLGINHQTRPFQPKGYPKDDSNPFYRYDRTSASCADVAWKPARTCRSTKP